MDPLPRVGAPGNPLPAPKRAGPADAPTAPPAPGLAGDQRVTGAAPDLGAELVKPRLEDIVVASIEKADDVDQQIFARWLLDWAREQRAEANADWRLRMIPPEKRDEYRTRLRRMAAEPDGGLAGAVEAAAEIAALTSGKQAQ